jgi:AcrR family transcriptional regulator
VLVKPFEPQMVISRVKDLIAGRRPVQKMPPAQPLPLPSTDTMRTTASATNPAGAASVDEYFDRLDAAFASLDSLPARTESVEAARGPHTSPGTTNTGLGHELANWHPEVEVPRGEADAPAPLVPAPSAAPLPTLAEAFAALLSAERGSPVTAPAAAPAAAPGAAHEELIEQVTRRVIERIGADSVRGAVIEVAERLVAEEIARIKAAAR